MKEENRVGSHMGQSTRWIATAYCNRRKETCKPHFNSRVGVEELHTIQVTHTLISKVQSLPFHMMTWWDIIPRLLYANSKVQAPGHPRFRMLTKTKPQTELSHSTTHTRQTLKSLLQPPPPPSPRILKPKVKNHQTTPVSNSQIPILTLRARFLKVYFFAFAWNKMPWRRTILFSTIHFFGGMNMAARPVGGVRATNFCWAWGVIIMLRKWY